MLGLVPYLKELVVKEAFSGQHKILTSDFLTALKVSNQDSPTQNSMEDPLLLSPASLLIAKPSLIPDLAYIDFQIYHSPNFRVDLLSEMLLSRIISREASSLLSYSSPESLGGTFDQADNLNNSSDITSGENPQIFTSNRDYPAQLSSGPLKDIRLCFILPNDSSQGKVPFELAKMVNRLRLASTANIQSKVRCDEWERRF
ncbi:hypothetical protein BDP27DRAFT_1337161 [Rhodocollybia butyracea]|uniref:Uncharacterized protein n=1 Tax=Rhodocollybia butyracea TaxID=206335 RepID=A0A9P5PBM1_9AGAR|nr:hypothetical protein BDP27DRAFT_1337161 [Rhodocollybia butyracea]